VDLPVHAALYTNRRNASAFAPPAASGRLNAQHISLAKLPAAFFRKLNLSLGPCLRNLKWSR